MKNTGSAMQSRFMFTIKKVNGIIWLLFKMKPTLSYWKTYNCYLVLPGVAIMILFSIFKWALCNDMITVVLYLTSGSDDQTSLLSCLQK